MSTFRADEDCKAAAFTPEALYYSRDAHANAADPTQSGFTHAMGCQGVGFYSWMEGADTERTKATNPSLLLQAKRGYISSNTSNPNQFRLERFGAGMAGLKQVQVSGSILQGEHCLSIKLWYLVKLFS
jgi:hypothetical protein